MTPPADQLLADLDANHYVMIEDEDGRTVPWLASDIADRIRKAEAALAAAEKDNAKLRERTIEECALRVEAMLVESSAFGYPTIRAMVRHVRALAPKPDAKEGGKP